MRRRDVLAGAVGALGGLAGCLGSSGEGQGAAPSAPDSTPPGATGTAEGTDGDAVTVAAAAVGPDEATLSLTRRLFAERPCPATAGDPPAVCTRRAHDTLPVALVAEPPVVAGSGRSTDPGTVTVRLYNAAATAAAVDPAWRLRRLTDDGHWRHVGDGDGPTRVPAQGSQAWRFVQDPFVPVDTPAPEPTTAPGESQERAWTLPHGEYALIVSVTVPAGTRLGPNAPADAGGRVDLVARFLFRGGSILHESP